MDFLTDPIYTDFGRSDFIGGIDNEALDFGHLEQFIHVAASSGGDDVPTAVSSTAVNEVLIKTANTNNRNNNAPAQSHLPESPPDSVSEPPFSPVDLQGLTLTSRAISNCPSINNDGSIVDAESPLGAVQNIKPPPVLETLTHLSENMHQQYHNKQHQHIQNIHHNHVFVEHNEQHSLLLPATSHLQHQQSVHHGETATIGSTSAIVGGSIYSPDRHDHPSELSDSLLAIDNRQNNQPQPHTNNNIHIVGSMSELIDMDPQRTPYSRQIMTLTQHEQHAHSIIPSDVYMGTPGTIIESTISATLPTRKRKLSQVDGPTSLMTIKPEPVSSLTPICPKTLNPTSPVSINLQQIGSGLGGVGSVSPSSSSFSPTSTNLSMSNDNNSLDGVGSATPNGTSFLGSIATDSSSESSPIQCIRFSPFQQHNWHTLCDQSLRELTVAHYRVDADKGFNFSVSDDAFVCQKKNHFQITCHARLQGDAKFVRTPSGLEKIKSFHLHFYGVKLEAPNQTIRVEQSQSDRSKKPFYPVPIDLQSHMVSKVTVGRLHFSETTNNNMRKKGRPNPEQRYFQLVVGLHVHTHTGHFPVVSQSSERIIVRASNPGQFESDVELCWQRGIAPESIFHAGRVGINTDRPDESLVIHGNLKVSGHIIQPSDSRAKQEISELDTAVQLRNLQKIRIVRYRYEPEFALHSGLKSINDDEEIIDTGVIAQEVREVLPDAVTEAGSIVLPSGQVIENFLLVNKDRILMENIGAVKELCKVTGSLETRIEQLEKINNRLMRMQEIERSKKKQLLINGEMIDGEDDMCSNRTIQMMIIILVIIMATCLVAVSTLYFVEHSKQRYMKRYDQYDISHRPFTHDAILVNSNTNNARNLNHHGYHTNKNGKLILHGHTLRPALAPAPIPLPIQHSSMASSFPLYAQPSIPLSVIPPSYPSAVESTASTSFHGLFISSDGHNADDISIGVEKPASQIMFVSHVNNKTANSKNKSKWPSTPSDAIATIMPSFILPNSFNEPQEDNLNISEASSEKVADAIPVNPDFENNSIDGSDQKHEARSIIHDKSDSSVEHGNNSGGANRSDGSTGNVENSVISIGGDVVGVGPIKIDSAGGANASSTSSSSSVSTLFVAYKNIPGKKFNDTISQQVNFTNETPSLANQSSGIDAEENDLQNLGNNNDSDDQSLSEVAATSPVVEKNVALAPIGIPDHCVKIKREEISNCQSACFEDSNSLISSQNSESEIRRQHMRKQGSSNTTSDSLSSLASNSPSAVHSETVKRVLTDIDQDDQDQEVSEQPHNEPDRSEHILLALKDKRSSAHKDSKRKADTVEVQSVENERIISLECSTVTPWLLADTFNVSLGCEEVCFNGGNSLNITYMIPLSKYLRETNVELHFLTPLSLHWSVCNNKEMTKRDGATFINPINNGKVFQKSQNVSIFYLTIPGHGHVERSIELRAAIDLNKNLCREQVDEINVLLQYNIRLVRDCD